MKELIKKIIYFPVIIFIKLAYKGFNYWDYSPFYLFKFALRQKFFGENKKVPWPVHPTSQVKAHENIARGSKAPGSGMNCYLDGRNGIIIGDNVWIGPRVSIVSMNHEVTNYKKYIKEKPIKIGKNSWLATNCIILPGVEIGEHTVVAAGAIVTKSFPDGNQILAGNPAKILKKIPPYTN
jgi:acetyltransferase-like isoleucine patch superfamily enzyme